MSVATRSSLALSLALFAALALPLLSPLVPAQAQGPGPSPVPQQAGWPSSFGTVWKGPPLPIDLVGDDRPEVVVVNGDSLVVLNHAGDPVPGWPSFPLTLLESTELRFLAAGDIDGDMVPEIVAKENNDPILFVLESTGELKPGWPIDFGVQGVSGIGELILEDLDGDGTMDLVFRGGLSSGPDPAAVFAVNANGRALAGWPVAVAEPVTDLAIGDVDFDGANEVFVSTVDWSGTGDPIDSPCYLFNGDGTLREGWPAYPPGSGGARRLDDAVIADLDGDFSCEIFGRHSGSLRFFRADGTMFHNPIPSFGWPSPAPVADLDGDGGLEIVITGETLRIFDPGNSSMVEESLPQANFYQAVIGDLDGDGVPEIVTTSLTGSTTYLNVLNTSLEQLPGWPVAFSPSGIRNEISLADLDGDDDLEVLVSFRETVYAFDVPNPGGQPATAQWPTWAHNPAHTSFYHQDAVPVVAFTRGDANRDGQIALDDVILGLTVLAGGAVVGCPAQLDVDGSNTLELSDPVSLLGMLFLEVPITIPAPYPECGPPPESTTLECALEACP